MSVYTIYADGPDGRVPHFYADTDLPELEVVPKPLADELAAAADAYRADPLPEFEPQKGHRLDDAIARYCEATG